MTSLQPPKSNTNVGSSKWKLLHPIRLFFKNRLHSSPTIESWYVPDAGSVTTLTEALSTSRTTMNDDVKITLRRLDPGAVAGGEGDLAGIALPTFQVTRPSDDPEVDTPLPSPWVLDARWLDMMEVIPPAPSDSKQDPVANSLSSSRLLEHDKAGQYICQTETLGDVGAPLLVDLDINTVPSTMTLTPPLSREGCLTAGPTCMHLPSTKTQDKGLPLPSLKQARPRVSSISNSLCFAKPMLKNILRKNHSFAELPKNKDSWKDVESTRLRDNDEEALSSIVLDIRRRPRASSVTSLSPTSIWTRPIGNEPPSAPPCIMEFADCNGHDTNEGI